MAVVSPLLVTDRLLRSWFRSADRVAPDENEMVCVSCGQRQPL